MTLMSSTMIAPALPAISHDLHTNDATTQLTLSIFVLSFAFGPMILAPMTEVFGRKPVWLLSGCFYIIWNTVCGFSTSNGVMIASRFLAGLGGSSQYAVSSSQRNKFKYQLTLCTAIDRESGIKRLLATRTTGTFACGCFCFAAFRASYRPYTRRFTDWLYRMEVDFLGFVYVGRFTHASGTFCFPRNPR